MLLEKTYTTHPSTGVKKILTTSMHYKKLGNSTLSISEIGFGCMSLGNDGVDTKKLIDAALGQGINYFDTADVYQNGNNEVILGNVLAKKRSGVVIATKVGNQLRNDGNGFDWNPTKDYILQAVDKSLARLQTDYIDLYQLHGGTLEDPIDDIIEAFELLKQQGKIRFYGLSSIRPTVIREYVKRSSIVSVMMQYSLLDRRPEESSLALLQQHTIGVVARGCLAKGLLVDKPAQPYLNYPAHDVDAVKKAVDNQSKNKRTPTETAVKFVLDNTAITSAVIGIRTPAQVKALANISHARNLEACEMDQLKNTIRANVYEDHR